MSRCDPRAAREPREDEGAREVSWRGIPLRSIRLYLEEVRRWLATPIVSESGTVVEVDPFSVVGGGKALLPRELQFLLWGRAPFPRPRKWRRLLKAHGEGIPLPPIVLYRTPGGLICRDGNHRLLLARLLGRRKIAAWIFPVQAGPPGKGGCS